MTLDIDLGSMLALLILVSCLFTIELCMNFLMVFFLAFIKNGSQNGPADNVSFIIVGYILATFSRSSICYCIVVARC